ncbi:unnamed protein product, partial [Allacma fusca]
TPLPSSVMAEVARKVLSPAESGRLIVDTARDVAIIKKGVEDAAEHIYDSLQSGKLSLQNFKQAELHPKVADEKAIDWIFLVDTLNFSFWSGCSKSEGEETPKWQVKYNGNIYTGYFAFCAGVNRAITEEGLDITNPKVFGSLTVDDVSRIFRSETTTPIPLVQERVNSLKEVADVLLSKYSGSFVNCVKASKGSALELLKTVVEDFPCYRDQAPYVYDENTTVTFYKRAQILIADIWACFEGQGLGQFSDINSLTMFADYRYVNEALVVSQFLGQIHDLQKALEEDLELANGDRREIEIRAASIHAVELIKEKVQQRLRENGQKEDSINSIMIDHFLWDYRRENAEALEKHPYHKTRCIFY